MLDFYYLIENYLVILMLELLERKLFGYFDFGANTLIDELETHVSMYILTNLLIQNPVIIIYKI